jgi:hypothetical protein
MDSIHCILQEPCIPSKSCSVHKGCYLGDAKQIYGGDDGSRWLCDKCIWKKKREYEQRSIDPTSPSTPSDTDDEPACCLCMLHGGALKQLDERASATPRWAHVLCAMCIPDIEMKQPAQRAGIHVPPRASAAPPKPSRRCIYCSKFTGSAADATYTVKCDIDFGQRHFHVTCAHLYDQCFFDSDDWPSRVYIACHEHADVSKLKSVQSKVSIYVSLYLSQIRVLMSSHLLFHLL